MRRFCVALGFAAAAVTGCRTTTSIPVPGIDGCYYPSAAANRVEDIYCYDHYRESQIKKSKWASEFSGLWVGRPLSDVETDDRFSLMTPTVKVTSNGLQLWTYTEGGSCSMEETGASRVARALHAAAVGLHQNQVDCDTRVSDQSAHTTCTQAPAPGPAPSAVLERVCKNPDWTAQFTIASGVVKKARLIY
jgi:hypothetical protein